MNFLLSMCGPALVSIFLCCTTAVTYDHVIDGCTNLKILKVGEFHVDIPNDVDSLRHAESGF